MTLVPAEPGPRYEEYDGTSEAPWWCFSLVALRNALVQRCTDVHDSAYTGSLHPAQKNNFNQKLQIQSGLYYNIVV